MVSFLALCPKVDGLCLIIISSLQNTEINISAISMFCIGIFVPFGIISQSANCSPNLVCDYLAVSDVFVDICFCQSGFERLIWGDFPKYFECIYDYSFEVIAHVRHIDLHHALFLSCFCEESYIFFCLLEAGDELGYSGKGVTNYLRRAVNLVSYVDEIPGRGLVDTQLLASIGVISASGCDFSRNFFFMLMFLQCSLTYFSNVGRIVSCLCLYSYSVKLLLV
jgi:hypothetical protein